MNFYGGWCFRCSFNAVVQALEMDGSAWKQAGINLKLLGLQSCCYLKMKSPISSSLVENSTAYRKLLKSCS